jgi:hypothetical protein
MLRADVRAYGDRMGDRQIMRLYVLEQYTPGLDAGELVGEIARLMNASLVPRARGTFLRHVHSILVAGDETCFHCFEARGRGVRTLREFAARRGARLSEAELLTSEASPISGARSGERLQDHVDDQQDPEADEDNERRVGPGAAGDGREVGVRIVLRSADARHMDGRPTQNDEVE